MKSEMLGICFRACRTSFQPLVYLRLGEINPTWNSGKRVTLSFHLEETSSERQALTGDTPALVNVLQVESNLLLILLGCWYKV